MGKPSCLDLDALGLTYFEAKRHVTSRGFGDEIDWQAETSLADLHPQSLLREAAWVILSSGMSERVIHRVFVPITAIFFGWRDACEIMKNKTRCRNHALEVFGNPRKIDAIIGFADRLVADGFETVRQNLRSDSITYLQTYNFIGPITSYHLAKNIGLDVSKADRHLVRIADVLDFESAADLCQTIAAHVHESVKVVDIVLWRFATLQRDYCVILRKWLAWHSFSEAMCSA